MDLRVGIFKDIYETPYRLRMRRLSYILNKEDRMNLSKQDVIKISSFKGTHKGERCFVIGTAPSLTVEDLNLLLDEKSFMVNHGQRVYDKTPFRADYYVVSDGNMDKSIYNGVLDDKQRLKALFLPVENKDKKIDDERVIWIPYDSSTVFGACDKRVKKRSTHGVGAKISTDITEKVYSGKTVIFAAIQIAMYMGFEEIYLLGVDCNYDSANFHSEIVDDNVVQSEAKRRRLQKDAPLMIEQFNGLAQLLPYYGVKIYNATRGGRVEAFPRVRLEDIVQK